MKKDKEKAYSDFINMTLKAWTFERLTKDERGNLLKALDNAELSGTYEQRYATLHSVYYGFLCALDYCANPIGWREPEHPETMPRF